MRFFYIIFLIAISFYPKAQDSIVKNKIPALIPQKKEGKVGYINNSGKLMIPYQFKRALFFYEDCNLLNSPNKNIRKFGSNKYATASIGEQFYRINSLGKKVYTYKDADLGKCTNTFLQQKYSAVFFNNSYGIVKMGETNFYDYRNFIIYPQYQLLHIMEGNDLDNPMIVAVYNNKFGVIDIKQNIIIPFIYDDIKKNFSWKMAHLFEVSMDGKNYFYVDENHKKY